MRVELTKSSSCWSALGSPTLLMSEVARLTARGKEAELQTCSAFTAASGEWLSRSAAV